MYARLVNCFNPFSRQADLQALLNHSQSVAPYRVCQVSDHALIFSSCNGPFWALSALCKLIIYDWSVCRSLCVWGWHTLFSDCAAVWLGTCFNPWYYITKNLNFSFAGHSWMLLHLCLWHYDRRMFLSMKVQFFSFKVWNAAKMTMPWRTSKSCSTWFFWMMSILFA